MSTSPYEEARRIQIEENTKRMDALNPFTNALLPLQNPHRLSGSGCLAFLIAFIFYGHQWDLTLEENLRKYPRCIDPNNWAAFVQYRRKPKTVDMARKNAANRAKLKMNHTLGTKSIARTQKKLEKISGRKYSRGDMFGVSHKKPNGSFVNDEAKKKNDQLQAEIAKTHLENEAFVKVFGKEHGGFARSMGLGVTPSQLTTVCSPRLTSSSDDKEKMKQTQAEIDSLKDKALQVDILKEQVAFLMPKHNSNGNQVPE
ncbi:hypothetical protein QL285_021362 [Trifolium repens]|nr:hypothetical protein QL285_021362 [Trifolium repens]